ncbi:MAG: FimV/HubP family polar landmark protein [Polaromonas sp.]
MNNHGRWRIGALASAIALLGSMASLEAHALALGRITVQSALGESLRAEIDISDLTAEEASSLRIGVAAAEIFKSAGLEYTAAAAGLDVKLQRRTDGRSFLRLSSNRAITEPFVDLILEAKWSSGRVTRDYTMLFDPPNLRANSATLATPTAPVLARAPVASAGLPASETTPKPSFPPAARSAAVARAPMTRTPPAERMPVGARQVTVKAGDNASRIAAQYKPASVSLDQMLVALLRSNPDAFIGGNINVIKSGAVLDIPDAQAAHALSPGEATQTLIAQSKDFNTFRRKLADGVPATQIDSADRQVGGKVQARVEDRAQVNTTPDKLTLSKGAVQGKPATVAEEQAAKDAASRVAELSKNINDLNKLGAAPGTGGTAAGVSAITATPALTSASTSEAGTEISAPAEPARNTASEPVGAASAAAASAPAVIKPAAVIAPPPPEPGVVDQIRDNPLLPGVGALLALLGGLGFARYRKNKKMGHVDSSFLDSRLQPDSFFGASGGRRVDTNASIAGGSSMAFSPSQLDASGDVDPVAEADVYLAYGRDQQAEEILKEALRTYPARLAIHTKLLEIFAKRRDNKAFESMALNAFKLSQGQGAEWSYIRELGRDLDPGNAIYQSGGAPSANVPENRVSAVTPASTTASLDFPAMAPASKDLPDLDLDFSLDEAPDASMMPAPLDPPQTARSGSGRALPSAFLKLDELDLDLNLDAAPAVTPVSASPAASLPSTPANDSPPEIEILSEGLDFTPEPYSAPKASIAPAAPVTHSGMLEFDLDSLSLDLSPAAKAPAPALSDAEEDPLEIKFLLAEEFRILGDADGARSLADEVLAKARGPLKVKVQAFLNALS